ncbi:MAG: SUMF1/EgtB/PvdO family nonheme iron enzyme [Saprospiraceae bacterium]|nr:SUMF1/EgtB/PvdO family nonheme iron enzyme [Saprospiraceae bacterium]
MSTYRYPGVKPFETSDRHIFFGRDQDIADLYDLLVLEKLVVLFGKSGYGKSSLLNAGILPKFQNALPDSEVAYQPITVRFNLYVDDKSIPPLEQVRRRLQEETIENPEANFLANDTLWQQFKRRSPSPPPPRGGSGRGFLLVFDQFEEFFSYPKDQQTQFKEELAELLYKTLPQAVRDALDIFTAEQRSYLSRKLDVKAVFAIRSDRMSDLDSLKDKLHAILYKRYELKGLSPEQARQAIIAPAALLNTDEETFLSPPFAYTPAALDKIIQELTAPTIKKMDSGDFLPLGEGRGGAEAFQLQILCQYIENEVINGRIRDRDNDGTPDVHADDLPDIANVYEAYYRSQLDRLTPSERDAARELIEYGLLYEDTQKGEARRLSVDADLLVQQFAAQGATRALLTRLENTFLLRREMNTLGGYNYELSHDTLIAPVLKAKAEREAEKERIAAEQRAQEAEAKAREERRRSRRATIFAVVGFLLAAVAIGFGIWAFSLNRKSTAQRIEIENNLKALTEKEQALQLTLQEAKEARDTAEVRRIEAELATTEAERQEQRAKIAQKNAIQAGDRSALTLQVLQRTAAQTVTLLMRETDQNILQLNYAAARDKCQAALGLGQEYPEVLKRIQEVAFFYTESEQLSKADSTLQLLKIKSLRLDRTSLLTTIENLNTNYYDTLLRRYYPEMVTVEGATFTMGSDNDEDEKPPHTVTVDSFQMAKTETTVWQYNLFAVATGKTLEAPGWGCGAIIRL